MSDHDEQFDNTEEQPDDGADEQYEIYKQEQDELNESDEFVKLYGFEHNCRCAEDWAEGNLGLVSECYLGMCRDALDNLRETREQLATVEAENAQFRIQLVEAGVDLGSDQ